MPTRIESLEHEGEQRPNSPEAPEEVEPSATKQAAPEWTEFSDKHGAVFRTPEGEEDDDMGEPEPPGFHAYKSRYLEGTRDEKPKSKKTKAKQIN